MRGAGGEWRAARVTGDDGANSAKSYWHYWRCWHEGDGSGTRKSHCFRATVSIKLRRMCSANSSAEYVRFELLCL